VQLVWRVKLVAELRPGVMIESEVARIERDEHAGPPQHPRILNAPKDLLRVPRGFGRIRRSFGCTAPWAARMWAWDVRPVLEHHHPRKAQVTQPPGLARASEWNGVLMGWTPPDGIDVPKWRCWTLDDEVGGEC
jgi:hypothetical protein